MASEAAVEAAVKELRREEGNKRCFICDERGPTYVDTDHSAFVCTLCGGILREFTFKLKGLSMATFTQNEVKAIKQAGGNAGAERVWLPRFRGSKPKPGDKDNIRAFIKETFVTKKYREKSAKSKKYESSSEGESSEAEEEEIRTQRRRRGSSSKSVPRRESTASEDTAPSRRRRGSDDDFKTKPKRSISLKPAPSQPPRQQQRPGGSADLLDMGFDNVKVEDFNDFVGAKSASPVMAQTPAVPTLSAATSQQSKTSALVDPFDFGDFAEAVPSSNAASKQPQSQANIDPFGSLNVASVPSVVPTVQQAPSAQQAHLTLNTTRWTAPPGAQPFQQQQQQQQAPAPQNPVYAAYPQMGPQQEQVLAMMGTMMGNIPRNETLARIQQNPQLMQYFMQMSQAMAMMQMPLPTTPPAQAPQHVYPSTPSATAWSAPAATGGNNGGYVSSNPDKNPFVQMKLGNKPMAAPTEDYFAGFS